MKHFGQAPAHCPSCGGKMLKLREGAPKGEKAWRKLERDILATRARYAYTPEDVLKRSYRFIVARDMRKKPFDHWIGEKCAPVGLA